jgi:hypothetical protein
MKSIIAFGIAAAIAVVLMGVSIAGLNLACGSGLPGISAPQSVAPRVPIRFYDMWTGEDERPLVVRAAIDLVQAQSAVRAAPVSWSQNFFCGIKATDLVLAGFALFLIMLSILQALWLRRAMASVEEASRIVDSTMIATQRAYVVFREFQVNVTRLSAIEDIQSCTIQPIWENAGTTPTRNGRAHVNWRYFERAIPNDFDLADFDEMGNRVVSYDSYLPLVIGPRGTSFSPVIVIEGSTIRNVRELQGRVLIWGWAEYDDVFEGSRRHRTEFCYQMTVTGSMSSSHIGFRQYRRFNGVDDECERSTTIPTLRA